MKFPERRKGQRVIVFFELQDLKDYVRYELPKSARVEVVVRDTIGNMWLRVPGDDHAEIEPVDLMMKFPIRKIRKIFGRRLVFPNDTREQRKAS